ncbi:LOW QUALITY PROTEIN: hypothetical protein ACHAXR_003276 [Thalassiosira sp. AJA248-18]
MGVKNMLTRLLGGSNQNHQGAVCRIAQRSKNTIALPLVLSKIDKNGNMVSDLLGKGSPLMPKSIWKKRPRYEQRILEVYEHFHKIIKDLGSDETLKLGDQIYDFVYIIMCFPSDTKIARNIVMGQSKGKNTEPVDIFKGMVCFSKTDGDDMQDQILEDWNSLADEVGRNVLEEHASFLLKANLVKFYANRVDVFEEYLEFVTEKERIDGREFFEAKVSPAAKILKQFYDGSVQLEKQHKAFGDEHDSDGQTLIEDKLKELETIALWCMLTRPRPKVRFDRCMYIMSSDDSTDGLTLSGDEKSMIRDILDTTELGSKPTDRTKARAILARLNEYTLVHEHQGRIEPSEESKLHLEHVLPQNHENVPYWNESWPLPEEIKKWQHRLGNLALINQKKNSKISNHPFDMKKKDFELSPYPLTRALSKHEEWDVRSAQKNHNELIDLACKVFGLE